MAKKSMENETEAGNWDDRGVYTSALGFWCP